MCYSLISSTILLLQENLFIISGWTPRAILNMVKSSASWKTTFQRCYLQNQNIACLQQWMVISLKNVLVTLSQKYFWAGRIYRLFLDLMKWYRLTVRKQPRQKKRIKREQKPRIRKSKSSRKIYVDSDFQDHTGPCLYILWNRVIFDPVLNFTTASTVHSKYFYFFNSLRGRHRK